MNPIPDKCAELAQRLIPVADWRGDADERLPSAARALVALASDPGRARVADLAHSNEIALLVTLDRERTPAGPLGSMSTRVAELFSDDDEVAFAVLGNDLAPEPVDLCDRLTPTHLAGLSTALRWGWIGTTSTGASFASVVQILGACAVSPQVAVSERRRYVTDLDWDHGIYMADRAPHGDEALIELTMSLAEFARRTFHGTPPLGPL